jgi:hypothetical protein
VPAPPWRRLSLSSADEARLGYAGATLDTDDRGFLHVAWPGDTLRDFVLLHVLLHEVGHHVLQHKRRRRDRIARTRDHEAFAELYAARARRKLEETR